MTPPTRSVRTRLVAGALAAAAAAGCTSDGDSEPARSSSIATTAETSSTSTSTTTSSTTTTTTTLPPTTTTTIPLVTEGAVVLVANATGQPGAAGELSRQLSAAGFHLAEPTDAAGNEERLDVSKIYVRPGGEAVAGSIALALGGLNVGPMPTPAWIRGATAALGDATVLVMLGADLAGQQIPALAAADQPAERP